MKIINASIILKHMDDHNWASLNREQIESFVQDMDVTTLNQYIAGYMDALGEMEWILAEKHGNALRNTKMCYSCRWWANSEEVCCCESSEHCAHFTLGHDTCSCWEKDKML